MNKGRSFEGYEVTMNGVKMSIKMYLTIACSLALVGLAMIVYHNIRHFGEIWEQYPSILLMALRTNNRESFIQALYLVPKILLLSKQVVIAVGIGFIPAFMLSVHFFKSQAIKHRNSEYLRGAQIIPVSQIKRKMLFKKKNVPIGELRATFKDETAHFCIIGKTRSGKSMALKRAYHHLKKQGQRIVVYENKGDYLPSYYDPQTDVIFCPVDKRSIQWSIWNDTKTVMDIDQVICWSLIPKEQHENPFWGNAAREVLRAGLYYLFRKNQDMVTNAQIYKFFTSGPEHIATCISNIPEGKAAYEMISDPQSKQTQGVISTLINYITCLKYIKDQDGDFSVRDWIRKEGPGTLFIMNNAYTKDILKPLLTLMLDIISQEILSMTESLERRRYIILDEFGTLHPMNSIIALLTRGGGMGASVWIGVQDIGQIDEIYGSNLRKAIINSCGTKILLCVDEVDTKEYISSLIGDTEESEVSDSDSMGLNSYRDGRSISRSRKMKRLVMPSQLDSLPSLTGFCRLPAMPCTIIKIPVEHQPAKNPQIVMREEFFLHNILKSRVPGRMESPDMHLDGDKGKGVRTNPAMNQAAHVIDID